MLVALAGCSDNASAGTDVGGGSESDSESSGDCATCGAPCSGTCPDGATCTNGKCVKNGQGWTPFLVKGTDTCNPNNNACFATQTAEIWDPTPTCETWTEFDEQNKPRMYHSAAALLPDGRVISAGGGHRPYNSQSLEEQKTAEYFEPVYGNGTRPEYFIYPSNAPRYLGYHGELTIYSFEPSFVEARLIKLAAVTHGFDQGQMSIPLTITHNGIHYTVHGPTDSDKHTAAATAPPGYYMLFLRTSSGEISNGQYVQVGDQAAGKWACEATQSLIAEETVCDTTPVSGECPSGYESQEPIALPVFFYGMQNTEGWEVVAPPGTVRDPLAPTAEEIDSVLALCTIACEQQWASAGEIAANCASSGVFETPEFIGDEDVHMTFDLIPPDQQDGSGIFISEFSSTTVNCTLGESCCHEFDELLCNATNHRPTEASAPQGGPAEYVLPLSGTSTLTIGAGIPAVMALSGETAYGFCSTDASGACPFYLDRFEAGGTGTTQVRLECDDSSSEIVDVTDLRVRLVQPAFGVAYSGYVGFPAGGLIFETTLEVDSVPYSYRRPITTPILGTAEDDDFDFSSLEFGLVVPCNSSRSTVTVSLELTAGAATAGPPSISIVLPTSPPCSTAMDLDAMASDPDDDIVSIRWRMDDVLLDPTLTQVVPTGSHTLTAIATDARGATTTTTESFQCN